MDKPLTWKQTAAIFSAGIALAGAVWSTSWMLSSRMTSVEVRLTGVENSNREIRNVLERIAPPTVHVPTNVIAPSIYLPASTVAEKFNQ